jgi:hypothetical protein
MFAAAVASARERQYSGISFRDEVARRQRTV